MKIGETFENNGKLYKADPMPEFGWMEACNLCAFNRIDICYYLPRCIADLEGNHDDVIFIEVIK